MSRFDDLPADQKATLQLLLKQGKTYDELAGLLRLDGTAVRERALNALDALGPETTAGLSPEHQDEISDYLLGQQTASQRASTRTFLEGSAAGRAWARAVTGQLRPLAGDALPEIPAEPAETEQAFDALNARTAARERQEQSSKVGGVLLLLGAAAIVAVLVVLVVSRLGGDDKTDTQADDTPTATQADTTATTGTGTGATDANGGIEAQIPMSSTTSNALASGFILNQNGERVLGINGQDFPPNDPKKFNYAVWLKGPGTRAYRLGFVGGGVAASGAEKGRLVTGADPAAIAKAGTTAAEKAANKATAKSIRAALKNFYTYKELIVTQEPAGKDSKTPGKIVVSGPIVKPS
jgi:hypothetical protein